MPLTGDKRANAYPPEPAFFVADGSLKLSAASGGVRCEQEHSKGHRKARHWQCSSAHVPHVDEQEHSKAPRRWPGSPLRPS
eukprot:8934266-Pyramimonas_sp.AAC.1